MLKNGKKCRELGQKGKLTIYDQPFEPCVFDSNYAEMNKEECTEYLQFNSSGLGEVDSFERSNGLMERPPIDRIKMKFSDYNQFIRTININI